MVSSTRQPFVSFSNVHRSTHRAVCPHHHTPLLLLKIAARRSNQAVTRDAWIAHTPAMGCLGQHTQECTRSSVFTTIMHHLAVNPQHLHVCAYQDRAYAR